MSKNWYLMNSNTYFSGEEGDEFSNYANDGFVELLNVSPEAENVLIDNIPKRVIIQNVTTENLKLITIRHMLTHIGDSRAGAYVDFKNDKWLVIAKPDNNKMYEKSIIQRINHNLKFIDSNNNLITKPCIVSAKTLYTTGIKDEKVIEIPNGMVGIQLPYDEDTKKLDRQQAFVFNKTKYEITFYNEVEFDGLIVLICTEIGTSHLDDKVNEIADRWVQVGSEKIDRLPWLDNQQPPEEPEIPTEPIAGIRYEITPILQYQDDTPYEIYFNSWQKYSVKKFIDDVEVGGNFIFTLSDTKATILEITNNSCKVSVGNVIGKYVVNLIVTDTNTNEIAIEQTINIKGR